jgi:DNA polymerase elongation subunit (family B)
MQPNRNLVSFKRVRGWIFDLYPSKFGEFTVWVIGENDERIRLTDTFKPKIYVSENEQALDKLVCEFFKSGIVASWNFVYKYANPTDIEKSKVLEIELKDCRYISVFARRVLKAGGYLRYRVHSCDLRGEQAYFYDRAVFPLAFVEIEVEKNGLIYTLMDSVESVDYRVPPLRIIEVNVEVSKKGKIANLSDPIQRVVVNQTESVTVIESGNERDKLLDFVQIVKNLDPDVILTRGGDSYLFPYLVRRASVNGVLDMLVLSRDDVPLVAKSVRGRTYFSYGRTYYRAPLRRLYGRVHIDLNNTFILTECGIEGLIEIARMCRVPLHRASRSSIGSSMSSLQFYQALKNDFLVPRNKSIPEAFKSAYELLIGDRGGFVYEPKVGIHDDVGEVDFSSMYPALMVNNNISAETVLCKCCPDSKRRVPELGYHICEKRIGIVPKALKPVVEKRLLYKQLKEETKDSALKSVYDNRQGALKWILVTCFGYLGYRNAKFGTVDGHISVCAFGRDSFLKAARMAEGRGFSVLHGIVDSLWLKKEGASDSEYLDLCAEISRATGVSLNFEGRYRWIVFLPSKVHPNVGVLNRYYGVLESGKIRVRGLEVRRRDTPRFVYEAQTRMIDVLAEARNSKEFIHKIPECLKVVREYRRRLLEGEVPVWDLIIKKHLSKNPSDYRQMVSQAIAAKQLLKEGLQVSAGENVRFLFTNAENKRYERRVKPEELLEKNTRADFRKYLLLLYSAAANMLSPFGYSAKEIYDAVRGYQTVNLETFQS